LDFTSGKSDTFQKVTILMLAQKLLPHISFFKKLSAAKDS
jgi:hypothetical protein